MVEVAYRKGAHFVCASTGTTYSFSNTDGDWLTAFFGACLQGKTIYEAIVAADQYIYENFNDHQYFYNYTVWHTMGDTSVCLFPGGASS